MNAEVNNLETAQNQQESNRDLAARWIKDLRNAPSWIRKPSGERRNSEQQEN